MKARNLPTARGSEAAGVDEMTWDELAAKMASEGMGRPYVFPLYRHVHLLIPWTASVEVTP